MDLCIVSSKVRVDSDLGRLIVESNGGFQLLSGEQLRLGDKCYTCFRL